MSFVQVINNVCDIPTSQLPLSVMKCDRIGVTIPKDEFLADIEAYKYNLYGRILWHKGPTMLKFVP